MARDFEFIHAQMIAKRPSPRLDREVLAEAAHRKKRANHKGRLHWTNWERRSMATEKRRVAKINAVREDRLRADRLSAARAYWFGLREDLS